MQAQAAAPDIVQRAPAKLLGVYGCAAVFQDNLKARSEHAAPRGLDSAEPHLDRLFWLSLIGVANDVRQCFVDRQYDGTAVRLGKTQCLCEFPERVSDDAKRLRVAAQFHFEKEIPVTHEKALLRLMTYYPRPVNC